MLWYTLCVLSTLGYCSTPAAPFSHVSAVRGSRYFFVMVPALYRKDDKAFTVDFAQHYGVAYALEDDGSFKKLWKVKGWYAYPGDVFYSQDGRCLVRIIKFSVNDGKKNIDHLARQLVLEFYRDGKMIMDYRFADLIDDPAAGFIDSQKNGKSFILYSSMASPAVLTAFYLRSTSTAIHGDRSFDAFGDNDEFLVIETAEAKKLVFELKTGKVVLRLKADIQTEPPR